MKTLLLLLTTVLLISCVQEIPEEDLEAESFLGRDVSGNPSNPTPSAPDNLNGISLYAENCMSCHGDLANSTKRNSSATGIQEAINENAQMKVLNYLKALTPAQIEKIAEVLSDAPEPKAPILNSAVLSGSNYIISFTLPSGGLGAPQGGYDTHINNVDQNDRDAHSGFTRTIANLNTTQRQCFKLEARYLQLNPAVFLQSNELCIEPVAGDTTAPVISNITPTGSLNAGTMSTQLTLTTNEAANCRYSNSSSASFAQMMAMQSTGGASHSQTVSGLQAGQNYSYYFFCQDAAGNTSAKGMSSFMIMELVVDGAQLYAENCLSCHLPLNNSTKKNRSAQQIQNAIDTNGQMRAIPALRALTSAQVAAIAEVLAISAPPPPPPTSGNQSTLVKKYIIGTRRYIASKMTQIFYEQDQDSAVKDIIDNNIFEDDNGTFGGNCTIADTDCEGRDQIISAGLMLPNSNPIRSATIHNVCQLVLSRSRAVNSALRRAGLTTASSGNSTTNIAALFDVFYPGVPMTQEALDDLKNVYNQSRANGIDNANAWKMVMDPMCKSALFEAY